MKVVIYSGQKKFTVNNVSIPNAHAAWELARAQNQAYTVSEEELTYYNFEITSTRGVVFEDEDVLINEDIEREIEEGIHWKMESVN